MDMDHGGMSMGDSGLNHSGMDHSSMRTGDNPALTNTPSSGHHHHMTPSMMMVEREHFWFMIVGLGWRCSNSFLMENCGADVSFRTLGQVACYCWRIASSIK